MKNSPCRSTTKRPKAVRPSLQYQKRLAALYVGSYPHDGLYASSQHGSWGGSSGGSWGFGAGLGGVDACLGGIWRSFKGRVPMQACIFSHFPQRQETVPAEFEIGTLARVPESLAHFGGELVARGRGRLGGSRRRRRRARAVQHHGELRKLGRDPLIQRGVWGAAFNGVAGVLSALKKKSACKKTEGGFWFWGVSTRFFCNRFAVSVPLTSLNCSA